ncbi:MAG: sulfotransferase, partial [Candidatus Binatia bacterium]
ILNLKEAWAPRIKEIIAQKSKKDKIWGWKHPRTILTIELFLPHLRSPHFVAVFRNPLGIANSSVEHTKNYKSGRVDLLQALKLTSLYYGEMFKVLERHPEVPTISVAFEEVVTRPIQEAKRLGDFLGVELAEAAKAQIERLVISREEIAKEKQSATGLLGGKIPRLFRKYTRSLRGKQSSRK